MTTTPHIPFRRRQSGLVAYAAALLLFAPLLAHAASFGFEEVAQKAKQESLKPYQKPDTKLPPAIANLSYDQYRDIRFKPELNHWRKDGLPFELAFFHRGHYFQERVNIFEISAGDVHPIRYQPNQFNFGHTSLDPHTISDLGYAGFRIHYPLNTARYKDEVMVFLGGSYFRALGGGQNYGISARGLAIDTGAASGEEFPRFTDFWIERPQPDAKTLTFYALLDSPRVTGAYQFVLTPGSDTTVDVKARLFLRSKVGTLGVAPLTSMFFFGTNQHPTGDDYRPEVHDSDGLSIHSSTGEWLWRPLANPRQTITSSFEATNPRGFGLMQRQRAFNQYQDLEAHYETRPSLWIEPTDNWGKGRIELVELPEPDETHDNIVAYWTPDQQPRPLQPYDISYRMHWQKDNATKPPQSWVTQTRRGQAFLLNKDDSIGFQVDFAGPALSALPANATVDGVVTVDGNARLLGHNCYRNDATGGERLSLRLQRIDPKKPVELRAFLRSGNNTVSETWTYLLPPE